MTTKKTKTTTTNVAEKKTNVAKKATEQVKRPTIKSLQEEAKNLTEQLVYANKRVVELLPYKEEWLKAFGSEVKEDTVFETRPSYLRVYGEKYVPQDIYAITVGQLDDKLQELTKAQARIKELEERSILGQILYSITKRFK